MSVLILGFLVGFQKEGVLLSGILNFLWNPFFFTVKKNVSATEEVAGLLFKYILKFVFSVQCLLSLSTACGLFSHTHSATTTKHLCILQNKAGISV